ncbi:MAG: PTS sugar transporter subunit IIA [Hyphomonadaceae bacterium]
MTSLMDLVLEQAILPRVTAPSRRQALQIIAESLAGASGADARAAFEAVLLRERLSGTGIGEGAALPHARVPGLTRPVAAFARLDPAIDFDALDQRPADLVFMLLAPIERGGDHLKALARISRFLRRAGVREKLREARGLEDLRAVLSTPLHSDAA